MSSDLIPTAGLSRATLWPCDSPPLASMQQSADQAGGHSAALPHVLQDLRCPELVQLVPAIKAPTESLNYGCLAITLQYMQALLMENRGSRGAGHAFSRRRVLRCCWRSAVASLLPPRVPLPARPRVACAFGLTPEPTLRQRHTCAWCMSPARKPCLASPSTWPQLLKGGTAG